MKSTKIRDLILFTKYDPDTLFTMVLIEKNKNKKLGLRKIGEGITFMPLDEFLNCLSCAEEDLV